MVYIKYFLKKKGTYISLLFLYGFIYWVINKNNGSAMLCLIIAIIASFKNIYYLLSNPLHYVAGWQDNSNTRASQNRMKRAYNEELDCIKIEKEVKTGYYYGRDGEHYETTLKGCTCMDYKRRGIPCKHMYHLASQLGLISFEKKSKENQ